MIDESTEGCPRGREVRVEPEQRSALGNPRSILEQDVSDTAGGFSRNGNGFFGQEGADGGNVVTQCGGY